VVLNTYPLNLAEAISDTRVRTLVVDDSPFMLKILAQILQEAGKFDLVGTASNGCQALRYVSMLSPELVLMDVHMPRLNGIQATRYIKEREHAPVVIITTSDDSSAAKAMAEEAGADAFVAKHGDLRHGLIGTLQNLFGPSGARRAAATDISFQNPPVGEANRITAHENPRAKPVTDESSNPALAVRATQPTDHEKATASSETSFLGSAQRRHARCWRLIEHTRVRSPRHPVAPCLEPVAQLCASPPIQPTRKAGPKTHDTMKTRRRHGNLAKENAPTKKASGVPPTTEEIRQRAHEIFMARGDTPGNELDDWLRAEQELKQQRAAANTYNKSMN